MRLNLLQAPSISFGILLCLLSLINCQHSDKNEEQNNNPNKKQPLPEGLISTSGISEVTDSSFSFKNDSLSLTNVTVYTFKNGKMMTSLGRFFEKQQIKSTLSYFYDENGHLTENIIELHNKHSVIKSSRTYDIHGNKISIQRNEDGRITTFNYKNTYRDNRLVSVETTDGYDGSRIEKSEYKHDTKGHITEEKRTTKFFEVTDFNTYDSAGNEISYRQYEKGKLNDSFINIYKDGLLMQESFYQNQSVEPYVNRYTYNEKKQLVSEADESGNKTLYKNYDSTGNWHQKEQYSDEKLGTLTRRSFKY